MLIITSFILTVLLLFFMVRKNFTSPLFLFTITWWAIISFYSLRLFGIFDIQSNTQVVLFVGIMTFVGGYCVQSLISSKKKHLGRVYYDTPNFIRIRWIVVLIIILSLDFYSQQLRYALQGIPLDETKILLSLGKIDTGGWVMQYIVRPFEHITIALASYCVFHKKNEKIIIMSGLITAVLRFIGTGSKTILVYLVICLFFSYLLTPILEPELNSKRKLKVNKRGKFYLIGLGLGVTTFLFYYMSRDGDALQSLYFYLSGSVVLLDKVLNTTFYFDGSFNWGFNSFNSLVRLVVKLASMIGINLEGELLTRGTYTMIRYDLTNYVSNTRPYNAFVTMFANFYVDFGYVGVVGLSSLFGIFSSWQYQRLMKKPGIINYVIYCITAYYILYSMVRFQMMMLPWGLSMLYSLFLLPVLLNVRVKIGNKYI
ncbi:oligosaccharide repeat unit polymerase [Streptococcus suis]|uniref:Oligosaccharide repeat unit polymerase n=1 Tax=Streptococcus suis TaxID=1307 RepID=A0A6L8MVI6_STRSU|nr:oligosaccharide repeat unit polymerase [Streptococcus suis]